MTNVQWTPNGHQIRQTVYLLGHDRCPLAGTKSLPLTPGIPCGPGSPGRPSNPGDPEGPSEPRSPLGPGSPVSK